MNELAGISPHVYRCGRTVRSIDKKSYTISSENCNVFIFCIQGSTIHQVGDRKRLITQGTVEIIPPFFHQIIQTTSDTDTVIFYLYFDLFQRKNIHSGNEKPIRSDVPVEELYFVDQPTYKNMSADYDKLLHLIEQMESTFRENTPYAPLRRKALMLELLLAFLSAEPLEETGSVNSPAGHVARAMRYIERHCTDESLCAKSVAASLDLNETHLSRLFHRCIHMSMSKYIRCTRINRAKELFYLNKRVCDVAKLCGFTSVQSFCRCFKQIEGITPGEYIRRIA